MDPLLIPAPVWKQTRKTWQKHRLQYWAPANTVRGPDGQIYTDNLDQYGADLGPADELAPRSIQHTGWYSDIFNDETIRGSVCRIRGARFTQYVPTTFSSGWDSTVHYMRDAVRVPRGSDEDAHTDAIRDAALMADECARIEAERAKEDSAKDQAEQAIEECRENMANARAVVHALAIELRTVSLPPALCLAITDRIREARETMHENIARILELKENPWTIANT